MDDLLHGLSLLGPRLEQMANQIDQLSSQVAEHKVVLLQKAETTEVGQIRQQLSSLGQAIASRTEQSETEKQEFYAHVSEKVSKIGDTLEGKADAPKLAQLEDQLAKALETLSLKAEESAMRRAEEQLSVLSSSIGGKAEASTVQSLRQDLQAMEQSLSQTHLTDVEKLGSQIQELRLSKAESVLVDQLLSKERTLAATLSEKAEYAELEHLKIQVHALSGTLAQTGEGSSQEIEALQAKLQTLTASVGRCAGAAELRECMKDVCGAVDQKADAQKLDLLISQVEMLSDALAPKLRRATATPRPGSAKGRRPVSAAA
eukprot:TRINITY_DN19250_c0_g1_i2.p1 TRINITY_DN19250_c0_g1~~TRINITY_DN19250_c0_g1_i2.p1  ORF type:complete len:317 (-),score=98.70 TRINITY_DN19250_c0_g1_i2:85-1035(-)